jgi:predicted TIM-barrel fold metal-dependent hydrolase
MEHVGGYHYFPQALAVIVNNMKYHAGTAPSGNVFAGLTSVFTLHMNRFWHLKQDQMEELIAQAGARQLIFGLDFPYNMEKETKIALNAIRELQLTDEERAGILGGNLRRELGM